MAFGLAAVLAAGVVYQTAGTCLDRRRFRPPGRIFNVDGTALHLHPQGTGLPVTVLEAGIAGSSIGWALVQPQLARFTTVCGYDRAGLGWSARHRRPRTVPRMLEELAGLLRASRLPAPYVLVGHSFGGLLIHAFAARYPQLVSGLVFLDPVSLRAWSACSEPQRRRLATGARLSRRGAMLARFGIVRAALALLMSGNKKLSRRIGRAAAGSGSAVLERLLGEVQKLPPELWPAIRSHWSQPKCFLGMAAYLDSLPANAAAVNTMQLSPNLPVVVLSAGNATPEELAERDRFVAGNSARQHHVIEGAGHWLQLERPDAVVAAVRGMCRQPV